MGVVYKARDQRVNRFVAVKTLAEEAMTDPLRRKYFEREANAASAINHPHVVTIYEVDLERDVPFIAMEFVQGKPLDQLIPPHGLPFDDALNYALQIADALVAAHAIPVIHRDLKPSNIMVKADGYVKVVDFGLAKITIPEQVVENEVSGEAMESSPTVQLTKSEWIEEYIAGSAAYMSPEQIRGDDIDTRSDIFAFGVIFFEMLTGQRPFGGTNTRAMMRAIRDEEPASARRLVGNLPERLEQVLSDCLAKERDARFQSASELRRALQELAIQPQRRRRYVGFAAVVLSALLVLLWAIWLRNPPGSDLRPDVVTTFAGSQEYPSFAPDGNRVAFSWDGERRGDTQIYEISLTEKKEHQLTNGPGANRYPAWSPDGRWIAYSRLAGHSENAIYLLSPNEGTERKLTDFPGTGQMSWSPDGKWLAVSRNTGEVRGIFLLLIAGGESRRISNPGAGVQDGAPAVSWSGRQLAFIRCVSEFNCDVYVQKLDDSHLPLGSVRRITFNATGMSGLAWSPDGNSVIYSAAQTGRRHYLWRVPVRGGNTERIEAAGSDAYTPSVSQSRNRLMFSRHSRQFDIWRYKIGGEIDSLVSSGTLDQNSPQFSPSGDTIAYESNKSVDAEEIWLASADGLTTRRLTYGPGRHQGTPRWSPDGREIIFDSQGQDGSRIYRISAQGGTAKRVTNQNSNEYMPSWSHDGKWIYFTSEQAGHPEIWRIQIGEDAPEQVTRNFGFTAFLSDDDKTLYYIKNNSGSLFSMPASGGPEREVLPYVQNRAFAVMKEGIYYIGRKRDDNRFPLEYLQFSSNTIRLLTAVEGPTLGLGLTVSPDRGTILYTKGAGNFANLYVIENFH